MHRSFLVFAVAFLALMAGALFYAARLPVEKAAVPSQQAAAAPVAVEYPEFTLAGLDGEPVAFAQFAGRPRLLNFWATWCAPCRREIPLLKEFQARQGDDGTLVIGIAVDDMAEVQRYAEAADFNYPVLVGQDDAMAVADASGVPFNAMPFTMIVSREGQLLGAYLGELHASHLEDIESTLARLDAGDLTAADAKAALAQL